MGTNAESVKVVQLLADPITGNRSPFRFGSTILKVARHFVLHFAVYPGIPWELTSLFFSLFFSILFSFSMSSRGRSTIDNDTRIRPGSSTDRSTERPGESVKTDEAIAMRPFYTNPHLHLFHRPPSCRRRTFPAFIRTIPTYLPIYLLFSTWLERFLPF